MKTKNKTECNTGNAPFKKRITNFFQRKLPIDKDPTTINMRADTNDQAGKKKNSIIKIKTWEDRAIKAIDLGDSLLYNAAPLISALGVFVGGTAMLGGAMALASGIGIASTGTLWAVTLIGTAAFVVGSAVFWRHDP